MAPEKLLTEDNDTKKEKVPYDSKCEIYRYECTLGSFCTL